jgi:NADH-quinone oxidoreductase subunit J
VQGAQISFWLITVLVLVSGATAAFSRSIVRAAYSLFFTLAGMAGYYVLLGSDFLAITQVIIYVGGILVLLMFGVLLTNRPVERVRKGRLALYAVGSAAGVALMAGVLYRIIRQTPWHENANLPEPQSNVPLLGRLLLGEYLVPFELAGMTLLLCLIGAAYLVRRKER